MTQLHELGQRIAATIIKEHQAYRTFATNTYTYWHEPTGLLAPVGKAIRRANVEFIAPLFYAEERLVQGNSPEEIQKREEEMLGRKKQERLKLSS